NPGVKVSHSREFQTFMETAKVEYSREYNDREVARSRVRELDKFFLSKYKEWKKTRTPQPNVTPSYKPSIKSRIPSSSRRGISQELTMTPCDVSDSFAPDQPSKIVLESGQAGKHPGTSPEPVNPERVLRAVNQYATPDRDGVQNMIAR